MMHLTLQKFILFQKHIISIALAIFYTCLYVEKKSKKFNYSMKQTPYSNHNGLFYLRPLNNLEVNQESILEAIAQKLSVVLLFTKRLGIESKEVGN